MAASASAPIDVGRRHLRFGWWSLLLFLSLGFALELLHGFKVRLYLDVSNDTRRLMWTLAHAHGALLALIHLLFGLSVRALPELSTRHRPLISTALIGATCLLPGGFFLAGVSVSGFGPALGFLVVPVGGALALVAVFFLARASDRIRS